MHDPITDVVVLLFSAPGVALWLAGGILTLAIALIAFSEWFEYRPLMTALVDRCNDLFGVEAATFPDQFRYIDQRFSRSDAPLVFVRGWRAYRALLARKPEGGGFATSIHAAEVFDPMDESARALEWWANILVAIGLMITFMGIVAALSEATAAISAGGKSSGAVEAALVGLLAIAATKFWTSIAGVLGSILLRVVARRRRTRIERLEADFFYQLDALVDYAPPERVMIEQLAVLRRLETSLSLAAPAGSPP